MKRLVATLLLCAAASSALAQPRPFTPRMSCAQARSFVLNRGAVVLGTGTHTYDRYVSGLGFCEINETIEPAWVPTADTPQCPIGYRCVDRDYFDEWD